VASGLIDCGFIYSADVMFAAAASVLSDLTLFIGCQYCHVDLKCILQLNGSTAFPERRMRHHALSMLTVYNIPPQTNLSVCM